jgi:cytochrome d ubiquinol oxidase subunit II
MFSLENIWFFLVAFLLTGYVVLDGFDLGAGVLYPFVARAEDEKRVVRAAIGPVWDGNEVWLVTGAGALFAAFPVVYAMAFSGFYLAIMLVLFGLILRAVSLEYRHRDPSWGRVWDGAFFLGSLLPSLLVGCALGNVIRGVPMDANGDYLGTFLELLNPYALLVGVTGLFLIVTHGAAWLLVKTQPGALRDRLTFCRRITFIGFAALAVATSVATITVVPRSSDNVFGRPLGWLFLAVLAIALVYTIWQMFREDGELRAFIGSAATIAALAGIAAVGNNPEIVPARNTSPDTSLTVTNAASGSLTLQVMLVFAMIGVPIVLLYTAIVYRTFRGKVRPADAEY